MKSVSVVALILSAASMAMAQPGNPIMVPVPWLVSGLTISNIRHGTGQFWNVNISDTPTAAPQGFNTSCAYQSDTSYIFATMEPPYNAPCSDPNVTFGLFPDDKNLLFTFNVTHVWWGDCGGNNNTCGTPSPQRCVDNGTWSFSWDDVKGEEFDAQNNFGQAGGFTHIPFQMYPTRAKDSEKCEFC